MDKLLMKWAHGHEVIPLGFLGIKEPSEIRTEQLFGDERVEYRVSVKPKGENLYELQYVETEQPNRTKKGNQYWGSLELNFFGKQPSAHWREERGTECNVECLRIDDSVPMDGDDLTESIESEDPGETERIQLAKIRLKQWLFRAKVMDFERKCRVTGVSDFRFLIASHMIGWADCLKLAKDPESGRADQINGNNGLLLSPHIDKLFDSHRISFTDDGTLLYSKNVEEILTLWKIELSNLPPAHDFKAAQLHFLAHHRNQFEKRCLLAETTPIVAIHRYSKN